MSSGGQSANTGRMQNNIAKGILLITATCRRNFKKDECRNKYLSEEV